jgi:hypothetical protein
VVGTGTGRFVRLTAEADGEAVTVGLGAPVTTGTAVGRAGGETLGEATGGAVGVDRPDVSLSRS